MFVLCLCNVVCESYRFRGRGWGIFGGFILPTSLTHPFPPEPFSCHLTTGNLITVFLYLSVYITRYRGWHMGWPECCRSGILSWEASSPVWGGHTMLNGDRATQLSPPGIRVEVTEGWGPCERQLRRAALGLSAGQLSQAGPQCPGFLPCRTERQSLSGDLEGGPQGSGYWRGAAQRQAWLLCARGVTKGMPLHNHPMACCACLSPGQGGSSSAVLMSCRS